MKKTLMICALLAVAAQADVRYTKKVTYAQMESQGDEGGFSMKTITYLKGKRERKETLMQMGPMNMNQVELTLCDQEKRARVDPELQIYVAESLRPQVHAAAANPMTGAPAQKAAPVQGGSGTYTFHYKVQDLGPEKLAGMDTHHYKITMTMVASGCAGDTNATIEREVWMAAALPRLVCPVRDAGGDFSINHDGGPPCKIKVVSTGDVKLFQQASRGEAVKEILYQDGKPVMTTELVEHSTAPLPDSLFSLDGLKPVNDAQFQEQQQQKMMKQFQQP